jgi:hypothetical protein
MHTHCRSTTGRAARQDLERQVPELRDHVPQADRRLPDGDAPQSGALCETSCSRKVQAAVSRDSALILTAEYAHYGERAAETLSQPVRRPLRAVTR